MKKSKRAALLGAPAERRRKFIEALLAGTNSRDAVVEIYGPRTRKAIASIISSLRRDPAVHEALAREEEARLAVLSHTPARIEQQMGVFAFSDLAKIFNGDWSLKPLDEIDPSARACISNVQINEFTDPTTGATTRRVKLGLEKKHGPLRDLAQMHGMLKPDSTNVNVAAGFSININPEPPRDWRAEPVGPVVDVTPPRSPEPAPDPQDEADRHAKDLYEQARRPLDPNSQEAWEAELRLSRAGAAEVLSRMPVHRSRFAKGTPLQRRRVNTGAFDRLTFPIALEAIYQTVVSRRLPHSARLDRPPMCSFGN
jgi:hypothetical protein